MVVVPALPVGARTCDVDVIRVTVSRSFVVVDVGGGSGGGSGDASCSRHAVRHVTAAAGQRVRVTLYDFRLAYRRSRPEVGHVTGVCRLYAQVSERLAGGQHNVSVCAGRHREVNVYMSVGNSVRVTIAKGMAREGTPKFLLKYEGEFEN